MGFFRVLLAIIIGLVTLRLILAIMVGFALALVYVADGHLANDIVMVYHHIRNILNN